MTIDLATIKKLRATLPSTPWHVDFTPDGRCRLGLIAPDQTLAGIYLLGAILSGCDSYEDRRPRSEEGQPEAWAIARFLAASPEIVDWLIEQVESSQTATRAISLPSEGRLEVRSKLFNATTHEDMGAHDISYPQHEVINVYRVTPHGPWLCCGVNFHADFPHWPTYRAYLSYTPLKDPPPGVELRSGTT